MEDWYDFLIVGSGPSGCVLASRLARSAAKPRVLLIEAGSDNSDPKHQISGERFLTHKAAEGYNWGYLSVPQHQLKGQRLDQSRGRGLGGSSAINFMAYVRGPKESVTFSSSDFVDDYDEWARLVGDEAWSWGQANRKFNAIETYHGDVSNALKPYVNVSSASHGHDGPLDLEFAPSLEKGLMDLFDSAKECGFPLNLDLNSGDPIGIGIPASSALNGKRKSAATAYLFNKPANLFIVTETLATGVIIKDGRAIGVKTLGKSFYATKEVILSAGALDTPKILLLSGIGPADELEQLHIKVVKDVPGVGKRLRDHSFTPLTILQKPGTNDRANFYNDPAAVEAARKKFDVDASGQLAHFFCTCPMGFLKSDRITNSTEFQELPKPVQDHLQRRTVPHYEICSHAPPLWINKHEELKPTDTYLSILAFGQYPQSTGSVRLSSADPKDDLLIDPQFLSHPYDRRAAIEAVRHTLDLIEAPSMAKDTIKLVGAPSSKSDEDILDYIKSTLFSDWHMCGTVKMGKPEEEETCVNKDFKIVGIDGLRIVDMSIAPMITNTHTQSVAYLIGETAAEKLTQEYRLDEA